MKRTYDYCSYCQRTTEWQRGACLKCGRRKKGLFRAVVDALRWPYNIIQKNGDSHKPYK